MTLSTTDNIFEYDGDASTTAFAFPRKVISGSDLKVYLYDEDDDTYAPQTINTHWTFSGSGLSNGIYASGTVTFLSAPGADKVVVIFRDPALTQEQDFTTETNVKAALNRLADRIEMKLQRASARIDRTVRLGDGDTGSIAALDAIAGKAGLALIVNEDETGFDFGDDHLSVTATGSTTARPLADRFAEVFNVKDYGATGNGSTNDTTALQAAATACRLAGGGIVDLPPGTYIVDQAVLLGSNTIVRGCGAASIIKAHQSAFVGTNAGNNCYLLRNYNHAVSSLTDEKIVVEGITFQYGTVTISGGGAHAIAMKYVRHVTVRDCHFEKGENGTAFISCQDTVTDACHALDTTNCAFDHWGGSGNCKVVNSTVRITPGVNTAQAIQFTGTGSLGENLSTVDCLVQGCSVYGARNSVSNTASAIISNANDADSTTYRFRSHGNYVEGSDIGLVMSGEGGQHLSESDVFRSVTKQPIFLQTTNSDAPDYCRVLDPTLIDCDHEAGSALISISGTHHAVTGVKVVNTGAAAYDLIAYFAASSANNLLQIQEADDGSTGSRWQNDGSASTNRIIDYDATLNAIIHQQGQLRAPMPGMISGLTISNNGTDPTNDIDFAAGFCTDSTHVALITASAAMTKRLDAAWAAGTNQGGLDTGSIADTTYHCFIIKKDSNGVADFLFSASATAPTMPSGYTYFRRIGSVIRSSGALRTFSQRADEFLLLTPNTNANTADPGTAAVLQACTVPAGIQVEALINAYLGDGTAAAATHMLITSPDQTDTAPSNAICSLVTPALGAGLVAEAAGHFRARTNTSRQLRYRLDASNADITVRWTSHGWIDTRGRL